MFPETRVPRSTGTERNKSGIARASATQGTYAPGPIRHLERGRGTPPRRLKGSFLGDPSTPLRDNLLMIKLFTD